MTADEVTLLQQSIGKVVRFECTDGEAIVAKIDVVDVEEGEIVYEMVSTTDESKYEKFDKQPAYLIQFGEIITVRPFGGRPEQ